MQAEGCKLLLSKKKVSMLLITSSLCSSRKRRVADGKI
jgi:hypothetical protein